MVMVEIAPSTAENSHIIRNLYPLYLHDLSAFMDDDGAGPNAHGVLGEDDSIRCASCGTAQNIWWEEPQSCFPYVVWVGGRPAGFALVATWPYVSHLSNLSNLSNFVLCEFFIVRAYRGRGISEAAARSAFDTHRGWWELSVLARNTRATAFWRRTLGAYAPRGLVEGPSPSGYPVGLTFYFEN